MDPDPDRRDHDVKSCCVEFTPEALSMNDAACSELDAPSRWLAGWRVDYYLRLNAGRLAGRCPGTSHDIIKLG